MSCDVALRSAAFFLEQFDGVPAVAAQVTWALPGQRVPHCPQCGAFVSPTTGICNNPQCGDVGLCVTEPTQWPPPGVAWTKDRNVAAASQHSLCVRIEEGMTLFVDVADLGVTRGVAELFREIEAAGGTPYPVGGAVRDALLGRESKDLDVEVHGIAFGDLIDAVAGHDPEVVGQWGVVRMDIGDVEVELALPRREYKVGPGHSGFDVDLVPDLSMEEATARRGYRHSALMCHWRTGRIIDLHDGIHCLANGQARHTSERFAEDPQRVLRGAEQAARFGFDSIAPDTVALCKEMAPRHAELSKSEIWMEWEKLTARGQWPSQGLRFLRKVQWDRHYPGLAELSGADWDATLEAVDRAAEIAEREGLRAGKERGARRRQALVLAAMAHRMPAEAGDEGAATRGDFLRSINAPAKVHCEALDLTEGLDGWQGRIAGQNGRSIDVRTNWLALHLGDSDIPRWALLAEAVGEDPSPALEAGRRLSVLYEAPVVAPIDGNDMQRRTSEDEGTRSLDKESGQTAGEGCRQTRTSSGEGTEGARSAAASTGQTLPPCFLLDVAPHLPLCAVHPCRTDQPMCQAHRRTVQRMGYVQYLAVSIPASSVRHRRQRSVQRRLGSADLAHTECRHSAVAYGPGLPESIFARAHPQADVQPC